MGRDTDVSLVEIREGVVDDILNANMRRHLLLAQDKKTLD